MLGSWRGSGTLYINKRIRSQIYQMNTPCPKRLTHYDFTYIADEYNPRGRRDLTPIFELCLHSDVCPPTPPNTPIGQKSYYGKKRVIKANI